MCIYTVKNNNKNYKRKILKGGVRLHRTSQIRRKLGYRKN